MEIYAVLAVSIFADYPYHADDENNLSITKDFVVLKDGFPVGTLKNNL